jgi:hypothetical protein
MLCWSQFTESVIKFIIQFLMYNVHVQYGQDSYVLMWTMFPTICMEGTSRDVMFVVE